MHPLVDGTWVQDRLGREDLCVLNCSVTHVTGADGRPDWDSGRQAWANGHVPGSQYVDLVRDLSDSSSDLRLMMPPVDQLREALEAVGVADGRQVVLYDDNYSMWAARVWWMLRAVSIDAVLLDGGWRTWTREGRPVEVGDPPPVRAGSVALTPRPGTFATKEDVIDQLDEPSVCLIDALDPRVYGGEQVHYARPGHIVGAHNVSALHLVDRETHQYLPPDELRQHFAATTVHDADRVITYCGAGVAGASAAFALGLLGVQDVAVYDGSLTEWAADSSLPMSTEP